MHKIRIIFLVGTITFLAQATELTISLPGLYSLGENLVSVPTAADTIVNITVRDVVFDLANRIIVQNNATANVDGVVINSTVTDVTIQNGIIRNVTGSGIIINQGCSRIKINNIFFENCATRGVSLVGAAGVNQILNCEIKNCRFYNCCGGVAGDNAIRLNFCYGTAINDCTVSSSNGTALILVNLLSCVLCAVNNVVVRNNTATSLTAFQLSAGTGNTFTHCIVRNNSASGAVVGFNINTSTLNTIINCTVLANSSSTNACTGFNSITSTTNTYNQCKCISNSGSTGMTAFNAIGTGAIGGQCTFIDCAAFANSATGIGAQSTGYLVNGANFGTLLRCLALYNSSTASAAIGISFQGGGGTNWSVNDCIINRNIGNPAANSFGVRVVAGTNNFFARTIAFNNNTTIANQLTGLPAGSVSTPVAPATSNIASITLPLTNMAITT